MEPGGRTWRANLAGTARAPYRGRARLL